VSRPRRVFGGDRPGQLPATRLRILAAELADPQRLKRARGYAADGSVLDITITRRVVTATVLGSRPDPYLVELRVDAGFGPPARGEITSTCTCPDTTTPSASTVGWCKHALAALLAVADEVAVEPDVLVRWRGAAAERRHDDHAADVVPISVSAPVPHPLIERLDPPAGAEIPVIDDIEPVPATSLGDAELDRWVVSALAVLTGRGGSS
jgi:hypothetical protein